MAHEGMVHALEEIHRLLRSGGRLIDIHPVQAAPVVKVVRDGTVLFSAPLPAHDAEDYRHADAAVADAVRRRLFVVERRTTFDFLTSAGSVRELREYMEDANAYETCDDDQSKAAQRAELDARVEHAMRAAGRGAQVVHHEKARIARLRPL